MSRWAKRPEDIMAEAAKSQAESARRIAVALEQLAVLLKVDAPKQ